MSQEIKSITFKGELQVWGIYNYNQPEKRDGHDNHMGAKKFKIKTGNIKTYKDKKTKETKEKEEFKTIDYTSSRCIRHEIFKDLMPRQPSSKNFAEQFIEMVASEIGLLRGYLSPDEKVGKKELKGLKKCSPLHIADAQTIKDIDIAFDQGGSSKPKEGDLKNKKGEDKSDTSMFSKDNAPYRMQSLSGGINLKELQFLSLYNVDDDFSMIPKQDKEKFLKLLEAYFKKHKVDHKLSVKEYIDKESVYKVKMTGILLNQEQIRHLVKVVFQRIKMINGLKSGARLAYKPESLESCFFDGENQINLNESQLKQKLEDITFYSFFEEAKEVKKTKSA